MDKLSRPAWVSRAKWKSIFIAAALTVWPCKRFNRVKLLKALTPSSLLQTSLKPSLSCIGSFGEIAEVTFVRWVRTDDDFRACATPHPPPPNSHSHPLLNLTQNVCLSAFLIAHTHGISPFLIAFISVNGWLNSTQSSTHKGVN